MISYQYIDNQQDLDECCLTLNNSTLLSVDTEFVRERTFYPQPGLLQVSDGEIVSLIDPNADINLRVFFELLEDPKIRIVMHSSSEDIELFYHMGCGKIQNLFDTQIAAAWLGMGLSLSLQKIVEGYHSLVIEKQHSRTNWLQRPLSPAQLDYAAIDVLYLNSICLMQEQSLIEKQFLENMKEDCVLRCEKKVSDINDDTAYLKVKKAITASGSALGRLKKLATWREQQARIIDKPRQHIIKDLQLLAISIQNPEAPEQLLTKCDLPPFVVRRYGKDIISLLKDSSLNSSQNMELVNPVLNLRMINSGSITLNDCRELMKNIHLEHNIPVEVLPSKRWLEQFLLNHAASWYPLPDGWRGWRKMLLQAPLIKIIETNRYNMEPLKT